MKRLFLIWVFSLTALAIFSQGRFPIHTVTGGTPPATNLAIAHYPFENNGNDISGNGYTATTLNMVYGTTAPAAGSYYADFSTSTPEFTCPAGVAPTGTTFSWAFWFRQSASGGYYKFVDPHKDNTDYEAYFIWLDGVAFDIELRGYQDGTNNLDIARTSNSAWSPSSSWQLLIVTYDDGVVTMNLNGVELTMADGNTWNAANLSFGSAFRIGESFSGHLDEVQPFDLALDATQKTTLWNGGVPGAIITE